MPLVVNLVTILLNRSYHSNNYIWSLFGDMENFATYLIQLPDVIQGVSKESLQLEKVC